MNHTSRLLVFHRTIAPYRIDFFNDLSEAFDARVCLQYKNLLNQKFDYDKIIEQFRFNPIYLKELVRVNRSSLAVTIGSNWTNTARILYWSANSS